MNGTGTALTVPLDRLRLSDAGSAGRKAATLGELSRSGFAVPEGFVLCADALDEALEEAGGIPAKIDLPVRVRDALAAALAGLTGPFAVRSSGVAEDLPGRSYAGQYESVLGVEASEVEDAVRTCWASAFGEQVRSYGGDVTPRMAVIVQRMVPADAAGVAFSADPVSGDRAEAVVNAVRGLGDRLAAGTETPEEWHVRGGAADRRGGPQVLTDEEAGAVAALARRAASVLGAPQDIEWALTADGVHLLQSRPITALPPPPPDGFWLRGGYSLKPLSPMNVETLLRAVNLGSPSLFRYSLGERIQVRSIGGWSYVRFSGLTEPDAAAAKLRRIAASFRDGEPRRTVETWYAREEPALVEAIARMRATALPGVTDEALLGEIAERHRFADDAQRLHFLVGGASSAEVGRLGVLCEELFGWDVAKVLELLSGLPGKTTEPAVALDALVERVTALPPLADGPGLLDRIAEADPECAAALRGYLDEYGHRCMAADIAEPTLAERPADLLRMVTDRAAARTDLTAVARARAVTVAAARDALAPRDRARFGRVLSDAEAAYPLRDDSAFYAHVAWGLLRYAVLELADRLVRRDRLTEVADVFLLSLDEAVSALASDRDLAPLVARRRDEVAWAAAHRGPLTLGTPPAGGRPLAELIAELPAGDRKVLAVLGWVEAAYGIGQKRVEQEGTTLRGVAASAGTYTAPAKVIIGVTDFGKLRPGDVLVCPETTPQWAVLFGSAGALVTDTGGLLSHPAIIAREYGVPAVVATGNATRLIRDGQIVTVDGSSGTVTIEPELS